MRSLRPAVAGLISLSAAVAGLAATVAGRAAAATPTPLRGTIIVSAAASLTESFTKLGADFSRLHPGASVTFNFGASSTLATQIQQGAPADAFASADQVNMDRVVKGGLIAGRPAVFAENLLELVVAPGNPEHIKTLADTLRRGISLVLCAPQVPCGEFALQAYARQHLHVGTVPTGLNVKDTLSKVTLGEADVAVVYVTDVNAAKGSVTGVSIPPNQNVRAAYPIGVVRASSHRALARAFERYVLSRAGQATLRTYGFLAP